MDLLIDAVVHIYARNSASKAVLSRAQLTLHANRSTPHGASRLVQAMSACIVGMRGSMVKRLPGTAMHDNEYTPPSVAAS